MFTGFLLFTPTLTSVPGMGAVPGRALGLCQGWNLSKQLTVVMAGLKRYSQGVPYLLALSCHSVTTLGVWGCCAFGGRASLTMQEALGSSTSALGALEKLNEPAPP